MKWKNMVKYCQNDYDSDESDDFDDENEHHEKKIKKKSKKVDFDTIRRRVYCQNCFNESHFTKEYKLLIKFYKICKTRDHNTDQYPSKVVSGSCPSKDIILVHVVQIEMPRAQKQK